MPPRRLQPSLPPSPKLPQRLRLPPSLLPPPLTTPPPLLPTPSLPLPPSSPDVIASVFLSCRLRSQRRLPSFPVVAAAHSAPSPLSQLLPPLTAPPPLLVPSPPPTLSPAALKLPRRRRFPPLLPLLTSSPLLPPSFPLSTQCNPLSVSSHPPDPTLTPPLPFRLDPSTPPILIPSIQITSTLEPPHPDLATTLPSQSLLQT